MKTKKAVICLSIVLCLFVFLIGCRKEDDQSRSFFSLSGFNKEQVCSITVTYHGATVSLPSSHLETLLSSLEAAEIDGEGRESNEPFRICPYQFTFCTDEEEYAIDFCWFDGMVYKTDVNVPYEPILDHRFDAMLYGKWYTFYQTGETTWNSLVLKQIFDKLAAQQNVEVIPDYEWNGYDAEIHDIEGSNGFPIGSQYYDANAKEAIDAADTVIVGTFVELLPYDKDTYVPLSSKQMVKIEEVLKGDVQVNDVIPIYNRFFVMEMEDGSLHVNETHTYDPPLEEGQRYLFCLVYEEGWGTKDKPYGIYRIPFGVYGSAVIAEGKTYPRFNTEYHPFYGCTLEELRELAK